MPASMFRTQRRIGEYLLAHGWHAKSIAVATRPASAWVLADPSHRIRVHMNSGLAPILLEATATDVPGCPFSRESWGLTVYHAPPEALIDAVSIAPQARGASAADRRVIIRTLREAGMRPDRSRLVRALSGRGVWTDVERDAEAVWIAPYKAQPGGWSIHTSHAITHLDATAGIPAAVLMPLIMASPEREPKP